MDSEEELSSSRLLPDASDGSRSPVKDVVDSVSMVGAVPEISSDVTVSDSKVSLVSVFSADDSGVSVIDKLSVSSAIVVDVVPTAGSVLLLSKVKDSSRVLVGSVLEESSSEVSRALLVASVDPAVSLSELGSSSSVDDGKVVDSSSSVTMLVGSREVDKSSVDIVLLSSDAEALASAL